jgi:hypothetical protein
MTKDDLIGALQAVAKNFWDEYQRPMLLSQLPKVLEGHLQADYKPLIGTASLKSFIKETEAVGAYRLVEHPTQRAKVGIVPNVSDFEFTAEMELPSTDRLSRQDIEGFTRVLHSLTADELRRVSLPASLVVRLLETK